MKFREEYKKSAKEISPDRAAIDRMKAKIMSEIEQDSHKEKTQEKPHKKPLPFGKIAVIGGGAAACAALAIFAGLVLQRNSEDMVRENTVGSSMSSVSAADNAEITAEAGVVLNENNFVQLDSALTEGDTAENKWEETGDVEGSFDAAPLTEETKVTADTVITANTTTRADTNTIQTTVPKQSDAAPDRTDGGLNSNSAPSGGSSADDALNEPVESENMVDFDENVAFTADENIYDNSVVTEEGFDEIAEICFTEEEESVEALEDFVYKGEKIYWEEQWLYRTDSVADPQYERARMEDASSGDIFEVSIDGQYVYVYSPNGEYLGAYKR